LQRPVAIPGRFETSAVHDHLFLKTTRSMLAERK